MQAVVKYLQSGFMIFKGAMFLSLSHRASILNKQKSREGSIW
jgi:hypothetical protein